MCTQTSLDAKTWSDSVVVKTVVWTGLTIVVVVPFPTFIFSLVEGSTYAIHIHFVVLIYY